ncbi:DUF4296 domain-containing protein [uncultured Alistipes sp.]|jgi:hypothetical protein|uniref:DUF4296 domain-containing protein n=1 Tax=uncultured Alistipes sp. TaxID=538949 RepID=UPI000E99E8CB|nr:DUF4296 domain-containing protein [uncultured Alistipes sp.]HBX90132.1 DUF4296 domain-containing protein [Alistipes sp.]
MKPFFRFFACVSFALCSFACSHHTIIPDDELALIFHDAFLANAYLGGRNPTADSLNVYEPIFARYGYTTQDVQYTIGNFSKRKSARLGNVVERAITMLDAEGKDYSREVAILDTIDNVALRTARRTVRADSLIRVRSLADTSQLRFAFDVVPGAYDVQLTYLVDSLDRNTADAPRSRMWLESADGTQSQNYNIILRRRSEGYISHRFKADSGHRRLRIEFYSFTGRPQTPSVTVRNFKVEHTPEKAEAVDLLYERQLDLRIFADEFFRAAQKDSL